MMSQPTKYLSVIVACALLLTLTSSNIVSADSKQRSVPNTLVTTNCVLRPCQLNTADNNVLQLDIDKFTAVWRESFSDGDALFYHDFRTGVTELLVQDPYQQRDPNIQNNIVVYSSGPRGEFNDSIILYDILTKTQTDVYVTETEGVLKPKIDGTRIAWVNTMDNYNIHLLDLVTGEETQVTADSPNGAPVIQDGKIVYSRETVQVYPPNVISDIYIYDIKSGEEKMITNSPGSAYGPIFGRPDIDGDYIVYVARYDTDDPFDYKELYLYNMATGVTMQIPGTIGSAEYPSISDKQVVWQDGETNVEEDIFLYNISKNETKRLTNSPTRTIWPEISGNIVVWREGESGEGSLYYMRLK